MKGEVMVCFTTSQVAGGCSGGGRVCADCVLECVLLCDSGGLKECVCCVGVVGEKLCPLCLLLVCVVGGKQCRVCVCKRESRMGCLGGLYESVVG